MYASQLISDTRHGLLLLAIMVGEIHLSLINEYACRPQVQVQVFKVARHYKAHGGYPGYPD